MGQLLGQLFVIFGMVSLIMAIFVILPVLIKNLRSVSNLEKRGAVSALIKELQNKKIDQKRGGSERREEAAFALSRIGSLKAIEGLVQTLNGEQEDLWFQKKVISALMKTISQDVVKSLILTNKELSQKVDAVIVDELIFKLKDHNPNVRMSSMSKLIEIDKPAIIPLIETLEEVNYNNPLLSGYSKLHISHVRQNIAEVLGEIGDNSAIAILHTLLHDPYHYQSEHYRGHWGGRDTVYPVREAAKKAIEKIKSNAL